MNFYQFLVGLIGGLAWPVAAAYAAQKAYCLLKEKVPTIRSIKYKDIGLDTYVVEQELQVLQSTASSSVADSNIPKHKIDYISEYIDLFEKEEKKSKFNALQRGIFEVNKRLGHLGKNNNIDFENRDDLIKKLADKGILSRSQVGQIGSLHRIFSRLMNTEDPEFISDKSMVNYYYGCASTASFLDGILEKETPPEKEST